MSNEMKGRVVVVTGANAGIGRATARALAAMGARVLACGRNRERLDVALRARDAAPLGLAGRPPGACGAARLCLRWSPLLPP